MKLSSTSIERLHDRQHAHGAAGLRPAPHGGASLRAVQLPLYSDAVNDHRYLVQRESSRALVVLPDQDQCVAALLIVLLSPVFLLRAGWSWYLTGRIFDCRVSRLGVHSIRLIRFAGYRPGRRLPLLFNVLRKELKLVGEDVESAHAEAPNESRIQVCSQTRYGVFSVSAMRRMTGTDYAESSAKEVPGLKAKLALIARFIVARILQNTSALARPERFTLLGIDIDNLRLEEAVDDIVKQAGDGCKVRYAFVNPDCLNLACRHEAYRDVLQNQRQVFADGIGLQIAARLLGVHLKANVNGTDMLPLLCTALAENDMPLYLLGGREGVAETAAQSLVAQHPQLPIAGCQHGYFDEATTPEVIEQINRTKPRVVLVAMGAPQQELWIEQWRDSLDAPVVIGVGGLFDFYSGRINRCPRWMQDVGMEWIYRLMQEPQRMWRRYILGNPLFLLRVLKQKLQGSGVSLNPRLTSTGQWAMAATARVGIQRVSWRLMVGSTHGVKRVIDVVVSLCALLALAPLLGLVALCIRLESPGPVFFVQTRVGQWGSYFKMFKFRSMFIDAEERKAALMQENEMEGGVTFKMKSDPRITRMGKFVRKYSIDELPQLVNVLLGDMSLVGPRPPVPSEVNTYSLEDRRRLEVKPGITCFWQVSGRSEIPFAEQVNLDVEYIESQSLRQDIAILLRTVPAVLMGKGAY